MGASCFWNSERGARVPCVGGWRRGGRGRKARLPAGGVVSRLTGGPFQGGGPPRPSPEPCPWPPRPRPAARRAGAPGEGCRYGRRQRRGHGQRRRPLGSCPVQLSVTTGSFLTGAEQDHGALDAARQDDLPERAPGAAKGDDHVAAGQRAEVARQADGAALRHEKPHHIASVTPGRPRDHGCHFIPALRQRAIGMGSTPQWSGRTAAGPGPARRTAGPHGPLA